MVRLRIKNWDMYQHYKNRCPPWIKLHYKLLHSKDWVIASDSQRVLAIACMLIASHDDKNDGSFDADPDYFKRVAYLNSEPDFQGLVRLGFLEDASNVLADASKTLAFDINCKQTASKSLSEKETEKETEKEEEKETEAKVSVIEAAKAVSVELRVAGEKNLSMLRDVINNELTANPHWTPEAVAESLIETRLNYERLPEVKKPPPKFFVWPTPAFFSSGIWRQPEIWLNGANDKHGAAY